MQEKLPPIKVTPNYSKRTFTIRTRGSKYRTNDFNVDEFEELLYNVEEDWFNFLKTSDFYYSVK